MADRKISELPAAGTLSGSELIPIVQSGITSKTTVDSVRNFVKPYKVYTALLTQTGIGNVQGIQSGSLVIGVTYTINDYIPGDDFINVGAPLNQSGVKFVATGTTPNNWSGSSELLYDPGAPVVKVLENTIGNIWWEYHSVGDYYAGSSNLFTDGKTFVNIQNPFQGDLSVLVPMAATSTATNLITLFSFYLDVDNNTWNGVKQANDQFQNLPFEIRVYN